MGTLIKIIKFAIANWALIKSVIELLRKFFKGDATKEQVQECVGDACRVLEEKKQRGGLFSRLFKRRRR